MTGLPLKLAKEILHRSLSARHAPLKMSDNILKIPPKLYYCACSGKRVILMLVLKKTCFWSPERRKLSKTLKKWWCCYCCSTHIATNFQLKSCSPLLLTCLGVFKVELVECSCCELHLKAQEEKKSTRIQNRGSNFQSCCRHFLIWK